MTINIRPIETRDEPRWRDLWDAYTRFYEREPSEPLTVSTWARIFNPNVPVHAIVADDVDAGVVGIANYLIHESTSALRPGYHRLHLSAAGTAARAVSISALNQPGPA